MELSFTTKYATSPCHCGEDDCKGLECQYNSLCGSCGMVLGMNTHIFCINHVIHGDTTICYFCYQEDDFADTAKWTVE